MNIIAHYHKSCNPVFQIFRYFRAHYITGVIDAACSGKATFTYYGISAAGKSQVAIINLTFFFLIFEDCSNKFLQSESYNAAEVYSITAQEGRYWAKDVGRYPSALGRALYCSSLRKLLKVYSILHNCVQGGSLLKRIAMSTQPLMK